MQRGIRGSKARHISTSEYYRELLNQTETVKETLSQLELQQDKAQSELSKVKADVSKEKLKNTAADVGTKLMDGVSSLLGTPKMAKIEMENKNLYAKIDELQDENRTIRQCIETVEQNAANERTILKQQFYNREKELIKENIELKSSLTKIFDLFPYIKELLRWENILKNIGLSDGIIRRLFNREEVKGCTGELYSKEHSKRFHLENGLLKLDQDKEKPENIRLTVNSTSIYDWFR